MSFIYSCFETAEARYNDVMYKFKYIYIYIFVFIYIFIYMCV